LTERKNRGRKLFKFFSDFSWNVREAFFRFVFAWEGGGFKRRLHGKRSDG